jgi:hypothetical protein
VLPSVRGTVRIDSAQGAHDARRKNGIRKYVLYGNSLQSCTKFAGG